MTDDRTVHASYNGCEIVRYDTRGHWYREFTTPGAGRCRVSVADAARWALWGVRNAAGSVHFGRPGGGTFDRKVRNLDV